MTPDRWQVHAKSGDVEPNKAEPPGYHPIGPWEPVGGIWAPPSFVFIWRRPLRKINTTMDSPDLVR